MQKQQHTRTRVEEIDLFIAENCPLHGEDFCSQVLGESLAYIRVRVSVKKVKMLEYPEHRADFVNRLEYVMKLNKDLRRQNMALIVKGRR